MAGLLICIFKLVQWVQPKLTGRVPVGTTGSVSLVDQCIGIVLTGLFMLYFGMGGGVMLWTGSGCQWVVVWGIWRRRGGAEGGGEGLSPVCFLTYLFRLITRLKP